MVGAGALEGGVDVNDQLQRPPQLNFFACHVSDSFHEKLNISSTNCNMLACLCKCVI